MAKKESVKEKVREDVFAQVRETAAVNHEKDMANRSVGVDEPVEAVPAEAVEVTEEGEK